MRTEKEIKEKIKFFRELCKEYNHDVGGTHHDTECTSHNNANWLVWVLNTKVDIRKDIKNLDNNITNVVSREDGTLEVNVKKQSENTKSKVLKFINQRCLTDCFTKIDFHEVGEGL